MRLFSSISPRVYGQGTTLDEALIATLHWTVIEPLISMYTVMTAKIRLATENLSELLIKEELFPKKIE